MLSVANAKIIGQRKLNELVDKCVEMGNALPQFIYNIPKNQEAIIRSRILAGINARNSMEAAGRKKKTKMPTMMMLMPEEEEHEHECNLHKEV